MSSTECLSRFNDDDHDDDFDSIYRSQFTYTRCYCEENIWLLAKELTENLRLHTSSDLYVVLISNAIKVIGLYLKHGPIFWDYHVILIAKGESRTFYDFDADNVDFPCPISTYLKCALRPDNLLPSQYQRIYRVIPVEEFWKWFSSDRSHMITKVEDNIPVYGASPPAYPPIQLPGIKNNLFSHFVDITNKEIGMVYNEQEFVRFCTTNN